jgi:hypothetical protein
LHVGGPSEELDEDEAGDEPADVGPEGDAAALPTAPEDPAHELIRNQ